MKRSHSGTASPADNPRVSTILLIAALAVVLTFAGSFIFGLRRSTGDPDAAPADTSTTPQPQVVNDRRARIEVLNGAGKSGLAKLATSKLRDAGFDVVQFGNARSVSDTSVVLDRVGKTAVARDVGKALGITRVSTALDSSRFVDATVILGSDWRTQVEPPVQRPKSWKDKLLRR